MDNEVNKLEKESRKKNFASKLIIIKLIMITIDHSWFKNSKLSKRKKNKKK